VNESLVADLAMWRWGKQFLPPHKKIALNSLNRANISAMEVLAIGKKCWILGYPHPVGQLYGVGNAGMFLRQAYSGEKKSRNGWNRGDLLGFIFLRIGRKLNWVGEGGLLHL
jgi:hypothetical protein